MLPEQARTLLIGMSDRQESLLGERRRVDLQAKRQPFRAEPARDRYRRQADQVARAGAPRLGRALAVANRRVLRRGFPCDGWTDQDVHVVQRVKEVGAQPATVGLRLK